MAKSKIKFVCSSCGHTTPKWCGKCPSCDKWNTMKEELKEPTSKNKALSLSSDLEVKKLKDIEDKDYTRFSTGISEFDIVLGGGIVRGGITTISAEPGAGKSTLLMQTSLNVAREGRVVLYISGEEKEEQVKGRAIRLSEDNIPDNLYMKSDNNLENIKEYVKKVNPELLIIDSIQTVQSDMIDGKIGGTAQVDYCSQSLSSLGKKGSVSVFLVVQMTKENVMAGTRALEHLVDTVTTLEGDRRYPLRCLFTSKNRYGNTDEVGLFQMEETGLIPIDNPSEFFSREREKPLTGCSLAVTLEGTRPIIIEIQALTKEAIFGNPMRRAKGVDRQQLEVLIAILEQRAGMMLGNQDVYIKVSGGLRINEPAVDLSVLMAVGSCYSNITIDTSTCFIGEVGLTGEVLPVTQIEKRLKETHRLGYKRVYIPKGNLRGRKVDLDGLEIKEILTIKEVVLELLT